MTRGRQPSPAHSAPPQGDADRPRLLSQISICRRFGICDETWRRWRKAGKVPASAPLPGKPRWHVDVIDDFERRLKGEAPALRYFRTARRLRHAS